MSLFSIFYFASLSLVFANTQERRADDRPKDSQEVCGYTLKDGQADVGDTIAYIKLDMLGSADANSKAINAAVCAFKYDNPSFSDVRIVFTHVESARPYAAPPRLQDVVRGVLVNFKRK